ncbi:LacI family DNA-binding transcriptional regulator [Micromonospora halotolerans]|uniref:LacI family DNA-binding transcriptional regulator n=1 Tax=Micromonospora halotolerans TaxID=709879 RepID=A0ABY9ZWF6_9ACTN|nr:LacI family DNA-binding transcriptional regulator [Micromonospora halotolerans]WNM39237.1 LacI family DNA-binding transcriptional regulator [Micromonospora halotolerans]
MGNSRVTVREIARLAGVSVATVSRVSNGTGQVSEEMRRRVLEAIEEHGYRPDHLGRALAAGRHGALGLVFPGLSGPYFTELIQGFESEAVPARASVHILCTHLREDSDDQVLEMARRVDGIAVIGGTISEPALLRLAATVPVVVLAGRGPDTVSSVSVDNAPAMTRLTRHLLVDHGLRELAFVGNPDGSPDVSERWAGFRAAYREADLTPPAEPVRVAMQQPDGVLAAERLLVNGAAPQAVVCANDEIAIGVLVGALGRGLRVPEDLVITGFDDAPMAALVSPSLTTVRQPIRDLAAEAARQILNAAGDPHAAAPESIVLPTEFVVRRSCGCPAQPPTGGTGK